MSPKQLNRKIPGTIYEIELKKDIRKNAIEDYRLIIRLRGRIDGEIPIERPMTELVYKGIVELLEDRGVRYIKLDIENLATKLVQDITDDQDLEGVSSVESFRSLPTERIRTTTSTSESEVKILTTLEQRFLSLEQHLVTIEGHLKQLLDVVSDNVSSTEENLKPSTTSASTLAQLAKKKRLE
jgi:hypothetical protein